MPNISLVDVDGKTCRCVACNEVLYDHNHHCDPKREAEIERARQYEKWDLGRQQPRSFAGRQVTETGKIPAPRLWTFTPNTIPVPGSTTNAPNSLRPGLP